MRHARSGGLENEAKAIASRKPFSLIDKYVHRCSETSPLCCFSLNVSGISSRSKAHLGWYMWLCGSVYYLPIFSTARSAGGYRIRPTARRRTNILGDSYDMLSKQSASMRLPSRLVCSRRWMELHCRSCRGCVDSRRAFTHHTITQPKLYKPWSPQTTQPRRPDFIPQGEDTGKAHAAVEGENRRTTSSIVQITIMLSYIWSEIYDVLGRKMDWKEYERTYANDGLEGNESM